MSNSDPAFVTQRLSYAVNVLGFGVDPEGNDDSSAGFKAAIEVCRDRNYSTLHVPAGVYKISAYGVDTGCTQTGICLDNLAGLCIRGDGSDRGGGAAQVGTVIRFQLPAAGKVGFGIKGSEAIRFENLTIEGSEDESGTNAAIGVRIESVPAGMDPAKLASAIQFQNVTFRHCDIAVQTEASTADCSQLAFHDCDFSGNRIGFQCQDTGAVSHKFVGCVGGGEPISDSAFQGMDVMFDLPLGGNISVLGFAGQNIEVLVKAGSGSGSTGWNLLHNVRLEQIGNDDDLLWGNDHRTTLYFANSSDASTNQRTEFDGIVITPPEAGDPLDDGTPRVALLKGHTVVLRNASNVGTYQLATTTSPLLDFRDTGTFEGGTLRCYNVSVPFEARLDRDDVPDDGFYSFRECNDDNVPYPDLLHKPLYGPNYLMKVESHCWSVGDGLNGVRERTLGSGSVTAVAPNDVYRAGVLECATATSLDVAALSSATNALKFRGGEWRCQLSLRLTATGSTDNVVRAGFGDNDLASPGNNGVYFLYTGGSNWNVAGASGSTPGSGSTAVADTNWHTFEIVVDAAGACTFYIDGSEVGTRTAPASTVPVGLLPLQVQNTNAGETDGLAIQIDYYKYTFRPDTVGDMYPE